MTEPSASASQPNTSPTKVPVTANGGTTEQLAQLDDLKARATLKYSIKDFDAAAELYSEATELQAELNGELSAQNADLLYQYGRCLYHAAVKNSDVLGPKVAGEKPQERPKPKKGKKSVGPVGYGLHSLNRTVSDTSIADKWRSQGSE